MSVLADFVSTERNQYITHDGNLFASSLGEALRYYNFLLIVADRYKQTTRKFVSNSKKTWKLTPPQTSGPIPMTYKQIRLMEERSRLSTLIHLEIESFYMFANIFLDKIALFIQNYFGPEQGVPLSSHHKWQENHKQFRLAKDLTYPQGFSESIIFLKEHISRYRNRQIVHMESQRVTRAIAWGRTEHTKIAAYHIKSGEQSQSEELPELIQAIDIYIQQLITFIKSDRAKTRLKLK